MRSPQLGPEGEVSYRPTAAELAAMPMRAGVNFLEYSCGGRPVVARLFVLGVDERLVVSDIDGTITKSDVVGHLPGVRKACARVGRLREASR